MHELVRRQPTAEPARPVRIDVRVRSRWQEAQDVVALELVSANDAPLPSFEAGAFIDVELPNGLVRPYSLANAPHERERYLLAVLLDRLSNGGSRCLHASVQKEDRLRVSAPRNVFALHGGAIHHVLFAGGIGVTPLLSMAEHLWRTGASFDLHYVFRSRERAAFLHRLSQAPYRSRVHLWCSGAGFHRRFDAAKLLASVPRLAHIYACGPARFMNEVDRCAIQQGWPPERLHRESFQ